MDYEIVDGKVQTRALEYHIADHCNLRCDHCCSFSPILKKWFADPAEFERDLRAVSRVVQPEFVKIVGGEPTLHPELEDILVRSKAVKASPRTQLTTNGFLIERLTPRGWDCITMLSVSLYPDPPLPKPLIRYMAREAAKRNIQVSWKVQDQFTCMDRSAPAGYAETRDIFEGCWIRHRCNSIKQGRFYCCTRPQYVQKFAADPDLFREDGIPVDDPDAAALALRVQEHLRRSEPLNSCFLCNGGHAPLKTQRQLHPREVQAKRELLTQLSVLR
jgi:hypothetical protein